MRQWFTNLAVARKLVVSFGLVLLLTCGTLLADSLASAQQSSLTNRIVNHLDPAQLAANNIVTLVRAIDDDGAWMVNSLSGNPMHTAQLAVTYYHEINTLHATVQQALALADTDSQRQAIQQFVAFYWGTRSVTAADRKKLDAQTHDVFTGDDGYLFGNEVVFAEDRARHYLKAAYNYTTVPFLPALQSESVYIAAVQQEITQTTQQEQDAARLVLVLSTGLGALAVLLSIGMVTVIARSIALPLQRLDRAAGHLAVGDIHVADLLQPPGQRMAIHVRRDEIGRLGSAFGSLVDYLRAMTGAANAIADGNLGIEVTPRSEDDALGSAFQRMIEIQRGMADAADAIADGNLEVAVTPRSKDDVLGSAFQRMIDNQRALLSELKIWSQSLSAASSEILAMAAQQASGAHEQSAAIAETTATVAEVKASAEQTVQIADAVTRSAQQANGIAADGVAAVNHVTTGMNDIRLKVQSIAENILALSEQSQQIGEIIATVNDLADQSNLLALNAAIEASRAGEHGRGFTVVANEIRTLAEQSKAATAQVRTILSDIQRATNAAVMATEQGTKGVDAGSALLEGAGFTINELASAIEQASQSAIQIGASVDQHFVGMEQIAVAMTNINQATTQTLAATKSTEQAAEHLASLASQLIQIVEQFKA